MALNNGDHHLKLHSYTTALRKDKFLDLEKNKNLADYLKRMFSETEPEPIDITWVKLDKNSGHIAPNDDDYVVLYVSVSNCIHMNH